ncbi:MAG: dephospho-CoA kinase [Firmicutes bacterium]|nr:dephospho-CoA kinase [Bacillota bacterium]
MQYGMRLGLTGGIASGKSLVSGMLKNLGAEIIDVDMIARELVTPGSPALVEIEREFGADVILPAGTLDRRRLGDLVFTDPGALARLDAIMFPRMFAEVASRLGAFRFSRPRREGQSPAPISSRTPSSSQVPAPSQTPSGAGGDAEVVVPPGMIVVDAAILYEAGMDALVDRVIVVWADDETRIKRLMERNGLSRSDAAARVAAQVPLVEKVRRADFVIDNSGSVANTERQVRRLWGELVSWLAGPALRNNCGGARI